MGQGMRILGAHELSHIVLGPSLSSQWKTLDEGQL